MLPMCSTRRFFVYFACVCLFPTETGSESCRNVVLNNNNNLAQVKDFSCKIYLESVGLQAFYSKQIQTLVSCQYLKEEYLNGNHAKYADIHGKYSCACWPGYSDLLSTGGSDGLISLSSEYDISSIQCSTPCGTAYQNVLKIVDRSACACRNHYGCLFEQRTMLTQPNSNPIEVMNAILVIPTDIRLDSSIVYCKQFSEEYMVTMSEILTCQLSGIEYIFFTKCELSCIGQKNMLCTTNPVDNECELSCLDGFFPQISPSLTQECVPNIICNKNTFLNNSNQCQACEIGKYRPIAILIPEHENFNYYQSKIFCVDCSVGKTSSTAGEDCTTISKESALTGNIDFIGKQQCNQPGFGWTNDQYCRICPMNSISKKSTIRQSVFVCTECPIDQFTKDIGSTECLQCPEFHSRSHNLNTLFCEVCPEGKSYDKISKSCIECVANTVKLRDSLDCSACSLLHVSNVKRTICNECETGKLRHNESNFEKCQFCPATYYLLGTKCVPCFIDSIVCNPGYYMDTCINTTYTGVPCVCGCAPCTWQLKYEGFLENFHVLPGCTPSCRDGYKLDMQKVDSPRCIDQKTLHNETHALNFRKFSSVNSTDLNVYDCTSFLDLSTSDIFIFFNIESCSSNTPNRLIFSNTSLVNFISDVREIQDMDYFCFFQCVDGYTAQKSIGLGYFECVRTEQNCQMYVKEYETQYCYTSFV